MSFVVFFIAVVVLICRLVDDKFTVATANALKWKADYTADKYIEALRDCDMQREAYALYEDARNNQEFRKEIAEFWEHCGVDCHHHLVKTMPGWRYSGLHDKPYRDLATAIYMAKRGKSNYPTGNFDFWGLHIDHRFTEEERIKMVTELQRMIRVYHPWVQFVYIPSQYKVPDIGSFGIEGLRTIPWNNNYIKL